MDWEAEGLLEDCADERRARRAGRCSTGCTATGSRSRICAARSRSERLALLPVERLLSSEARYSGARDRREERARPRVLPGPAARARACGAGPGRARLRRERPRDRADGQPVPPGRAARRRGDGGPARARPRHGALRRGDPHARRPDAARGRHRRERAGRAARGGLGERCCRSPGRGSSTCSACTCARRCARRSSPPSSSRPGSSARAATAAVAFADLVGFTELGETIPSEELGSVAGRLSRLAEEVVEPPARDRQGDRRRGDARGARAGAAGRGDAAARRGLRRAEGLPAIRAGIAYGPAVNRWGDWYGSTVNVASRLTERARARLRCSRPRRCATRRRRLRVVVRGREDAQGPACRAA